MSACCFLQQAFLVRGGDMAGRKENLKPITTVEQAREMGRRGGIKSAEVKRKKKSMMETAKMLMSMQAENKSIKQNLESLGVKDKDDQTYQTAIIARMIQKHWLMVILTLQSFWLK